MSAFRDSGPQAALLSDEKRLHLQHGPIDLVIEATGQSNEVALAYRQAAVRFETVLTELVGELPLLRTPLATQLMAPVGTVARRMTNAVRSYTDDFVTPMAAVAGSVADEVLAAMTSGRKLERAYVNNGGDIALHLAPGARFRVGVVADPRSGASAATLELAAEQAVRGLATSGWQGRSHSLGIADAVTVLAETAAAADAAATLLANAVDLPGSPAVTRAPARELAPDSDLGERLVTVSVAELGEAEISQALDLGVAKAEVLRSQGLIVAAYLTLQGEVRVVPGQGPETAVSPQTAERKPGRESLAYA